MLPVVIAVPCAAVLLVGAIVMFRRRATAALDGDENDGVTPSDLNAPVAWLPVPAAAGGALAAPLLAPGTEV
jgi:hypothetical protein